jgi:colicin import membrane protein
MVKPTPPPASRDADIAIAKQKKAEQEQKLAQEQLKLKKQAEQKDKEKALEQQRQREKEKLAQAQRDKKEQAVKEQKEKDRKDKERKAQEAKSAAQDERKLQAMRDENLRRMAGMAGATGSPNATGDALRASGPSPSYGGRIIARVKPNIVFNPDDVSGNPVAEVEVRTAPDGKIMSRKLIKSSGNKAWDEAVIKALDKTDTLPRDTDGTIPTMMVLGFKPRD